MNPTKVPITRPALGDAEVEAACRVIRSGWLTQGPEVAAFEQDYAAAVGAPYAVAVSNCTVALELALRVLGVGPGDEVVTVSHSFVATANSVITVGAKPVFCDVEHDTFGMDPAKLESLIGPRTKAIMPVHQIGMPCDIQRIVKIAEARNIPVLEDAACAVGSEIRVGDTWQRIGRPHGTIACFSLHPRKIVTTGDGGMITTRDEAIAKRLKLLRQHAMSVPDTVRHHSDKVVFEEYTEPAYNCRMTDLQAAVGRPQIARLTEIVAERRRLAARYAERLANSRIVSVVKEREYARSNWQSYPLHLRDGLRISQVEVLQHLMDRGVAAKRGISNAHQEKAYAGKSTWSCGPACTEACRSGHCPQLAVSEKLRDTTILVPLFHGMKDDEQDRVVASLLELDSRA
jgi:dTDP-4-amino-4,6-dideoxygalactose transaminase